LGDPDVLRHDRGRHPRVARRPAGARRIPPAPTRRVRGLRRRVTTSAASRPVAAMGRPRGTGAGRSPGEPRKVAYLYILPAYLIFVLFLLVPLIRAGNISLFEWDGLTQSRWVGVANYRAIVTDTGLRAAFGHAA